MSDDRDNVDNIDREPETEPVLYDAETQVYDAEPPVQVYSADDIAVPPPRNWTGILLAALLVAAVLLAALLAYLFFGRDDNTLIPTSPPPSTSDDSWDRVRTTGRLIVGTSLDYPPFSYRNQEFQPDGFDMALIRDIAARLGVQTDIRDLAFDSLFTALDQRQVDVAIAAISVTPERQALVNFSNVYYVGEEGILARSDSAITVVTSLSDMAGRRIGVQRGSVYETWLQRDLVATGLTVASNLFVYETADAAIRDLREQRLDLTIVDRHVAQAALAQGGLRRVGGGLNQQRYAIAVRRGADALRNQVNLALTQMQNDGRLTQLAQTYLNLDPNAVITLPAPTATSVVPATVAPTQAPPTGCVNGMRFVADLNLDDNNMQSPPPVSPGQAFSKGWRIQNSGTCAWTTAYRLAFVDGNTPAASMGGQPTSVQGFVQAGQLYDMFVNLVAPLAPGVYQGIWQMVDDQNRPFGDRIWVGITVPASATATPLPTQTPSPSIDFRVDRNNILQGECVNFAWTVQGARSVYFYALGEAWQNNQVPPLSSRQVCPPNTTTYYLRVIRNDGNVEERQIAITVRPNVNAPTISQFVAAPPQVTVGQCVQLQWDVQGSVSRVTVSNQFRTIWDNAPSRGNTQDCTGAPTVIEYRLVANGPGGTSQALEHVTVVSPATATPVPTAPPSQPIIDTFTVLPAQIEAGQCIQITWSTSGATWLVRLLRNNVLVLDNASLVGSAQDCLQYPGNYSYQLVASTASGQSISRDQSVAVSEMPQANPLAGRTFRATAINVSATLPDTLITATFSAEGQLTGTGGCNNYNARYSLTGARPQGQIVISDLVSTNLLCPDPGLMTQEGDFFTALRAAAAYEFVTDDIVVFRNAAGQEVVRLEPAAAPR